MDIVRLHGLPRVHGVSVRRVLRSLLRRRASSAARRLVGDRPAGRTRDVPELGLPGTAAALQRCATGGRRMTATRNQTAEIAVLFSAEERHMELREEVRLGTACKRKALPTKRC